MQFNDPLFTSLEDSFGYGWPGQETRPPPQRNNANRDYMSRNTDNSKNSAMGAVPPRKWNISPPRCEAERPRRGLSYYDHTDVSPQSSPSFHHPPRRNAHASSSRTALEQPHRLQGQMKVTSGASSHSRTETFATGEHRRRVPDSQRDRRNPPTVRRHETYVNTPRSEMAERIVSSSCHSRTSNFGSGGIGHLKFF